MKISKFVTKKVIATLNANLYGRISYENLEPSFDKARLSLAFSHFVLYDQFGNIVLDASNPRIIWSLENLIQPNQSFHSIAADKVSIFVSRDKFGIWNFNKLYKTKKQVNKIQINELDFSDLSLFINDEINHNQVKHENLRLFFRKKRFKKVYKLKLETPLLEPAKPVGEPVMASSSLKDLSKNFKSNYLKIDGMVNLSNSQYFFENKLNFKIFNLDMINITLITSLIDTDFFRKLNSFLTKYSDQNSSLSSFLQVDSGSDAKELIFKTLIKNFASVPELEVLSSLELSEDLRIKDATLSYISSQFKLNGLVSSWLSKDPNFDLDLDLYNIDFYDLRSRFSEIKPYFPDIGLDLLSRVHDKRNLDGKVALKADMQSINFDASLNIENSYSRLKGQEQVIKTKAKGDYKKLYIQEFTIPIDFSIVNLHGNLDLENDGYDFYLKTEDLPLNKVKPFLVYAPNLQRYHSIINESDLKGYASLDVNLVRDAQAQSQFLKGKIRLAKADFYNKRLELLINHINADLDINKDRLILNGLNAEINDDYIGAEANFALNKDVKSSISLIAPRLKLANFNFLDSGDGICINDDYCLSQTSGNIKDLSVEIADTKNLFDTIKLKSKLDKLGFSINKAEPLKDISGAIEIDDEYIKFIDLSSVADDNKAFLLNGSLNKKTKLAKLQIQSKNFEAAIINSFSGIVPAVKNYDLKSGQVNCDLNLNGDSLTGKLNFSDLDFIANNSKFKYPILNMAADLEIKETELLAKEIKAQYGSSSLDIKDLSVKSYKSEDRYFDFEAAIKLAFGEFEYLLPAPVKELIRIKGILPLDLKMQGTKKKASLDIKAIVSKAEQFSFSNWLEIDKTKDVILKSKVFITPQLIYSKDSSVLFKEKITSASDEMMLKAKVATRLKSSYQVLDWKDKDKMSYDVFFNTVSENGSSNLALILPSIISVAPLRLSVEDGDFNCDTHGTNYSRQTACKFDVNNAVAEKYGIGDLKADKVLLDLVNFYWAPIYVKLRLKNGDWNGIDFKKVKADLKFSGPLLDINNLSANFVEGSAKASTKFNFNTFESEFKVSGDALSANKLAQGIWGFGSEVPAGLVSGNFSGRTKGIMPDDMFFNLEGTSNLIVKDGKLSQLKTMQKILTAVNTLKNFDFNNVFQTLITYKGGLFDYAISSLNYDKGKVSSDKVLLKAEEIELDMHGFVDYSDDQLWIEGGGLIPKKSKSFLGTVGIGEANLGNLISMANLNSSKKAKRFFEFKMVGPVIDIDKSIQSLRSNFKWQE